jgi:diacylglycerol kinase family enzyme
MGIMFILVNPKACGGLALRKWRHMQNYLHDQGCHFDFAMLTGTVRDEEYLTKMLMKGETDFVAAGGDGTINWLLNSLMSCVSTDQCKHIRLGAIGIGASNDFHKPFSPKKMFSDIPYAISFDNAQSFDVGCLEFAAGDTMLTRFFLINASIGITAEANDSFNHPNRLLRWLKRIHPTFAITYTALSSIAVFQNFRINLKCHEKGSHTISVSNLGVLKRPYFSGSLHYLTAERCRDGELSIALAERLSRFELLLLLVRLANGNNKQHRVLHTWQSSALTVSADKKFAVEYDGEIVHTRMVHFKNSIKQVKVCS